MGRAIGILPSAWGRTTSPRLPAPVINCPDLTRDVLLAFFHQPGVGLHPPDSRLLLLTALTPNGVGRAIDILPSAWGGLHPPDSWLLLLTALTSRGAGRAIGILPSAWGGTTSPRLPAPVINCPDLTRDVLLAFFHQPGVGLHPPDSRLLLLTALTSRGTRYWHSSISLGWDYIPQTPRSCY
ncbi:hypothetical protein NDU88_005243 [Pleurodeles waltl]|uniref:Uncharacterized protein n=1 Tax=Pleurodeles waltl TaxID=8319 RepID=A0AAV7WA63_PLEWA|nr:hypothetical protein NDU88_005243 [Pleurodeles waltl]